MPMNIAMPVAHVTGAATYVDWYGSNNDCIFEVANYFNQGGAKGINLRASAAGAGATNDALWNLYAFTDGFLSFRDNSLILRLPRELQARAVRAHNSGSQFASLRPRGPQLRHIVYAFSAAPDEASVETKIRAILNDAAHTGRTITRVYLPAAGTQRLDAYLAAAPSNIDVVLEEFLFGVTEIFVRAGDVVGNFRPYAIDISFHDSCGSISPDTVTGVPIIIRGRPLNPSYYLYVVRSSANRNANRVTVLTNVGLTPSHPLDHLFLAANIPATGNQNQSVDFTAAVPPKPLHVTVPVQTAGGDEIAGRGIAIGALGLWHESRNAVHPYATSAPVEWRNYGVDAADTNENDLCRFMTRVKIGQSNVLPGGAAFDHAHTPAALHDGRVRTYWERYDRIFNAVADALELPCELLVSLACAETSTGAWFNSAFAASREMHVIRMEPLSRQPAAIEPTNAVRQGWLTAYMNITGGVNGVGANAYLPAPWHAASRVSAAHTLTWGELAELIRRYPDGVKVSPGVMQTLVGTASSDIAWARGFYGDAFLTALTFVHEPTGVVLTADALPATNDLVFSEWFAVSVDAAGANTNTDPIDGTLTQLKRAFHNIIAGACHVKRSYNQATDSGRNLICDFDLPTVTSGYNDGAVRFAAATTASGTNERWKRLFALTFYDHSYPMNAPKFFNAAVSYFNSDFTSATPAFAKPAVRLWKP